MSINTDLSALDAYLTANPDKSARDFKGKGFDTFAPFDKDHVLSNEQPWHKLNPVAVRDAATTEKARFLTKGERQAAARDPGLVWVEATRSYCRRVAMLPHPQEPAREG
jgi:hypothetical protein